MEGEKEKREEQEKEERGMLGPATRPKLGLQGAIRPHQCTNSLIDS